jgi:hypothetical protein
MKKHTTQLAAMEILDNAGFTFKNAELRPESIRQYRKSNGGGEFVLYVTNDVNTSLLSELDCTIKNVKQDNGFDSPEFDAIKIIF